MNFGRRIVTTVSSVIISLFLSSALWDKANADCRNDQIDSCKKAVRAGNLDSFYAGGKCVEKHYVQYTHVCTVNQYLQNTDFCCCVTQNKVLCCRYEQDRGLYRCTQADDTIQTISSGSSSPIAKVVENLPLEILIPAIVVPIVLLLCCVGCLVKCCCCNEDNEDNLSCDTLCLKHKAAPSCDEKTYPLRTEDDQYTSQTVPLAGGPHQHPTRIDSQYSTGSTSSQSKLLPFSRSQEDGSIGPPPPVATAPPCTYNHGDNESAFVSIHTADGGGNSKQRRAGYNRLESENSAVFSPGSVEQNGVPGVVLEEAPKVAPPSYAEHYRDPRVVVNWDTRT